MEIEHPQKGDEAVVRGVASLVMLLAAAAALSSGALRFVLTLALTADFGLRALLGPKLSPLLWLSRQYLAQGFPSRLIRLRPKRFAAFIGLGFGVLGLIGHLAGLYRLTGALLSTLALFAWLEACLRFCAGCEVFALLIRWRVLPEETCPDCVERPPED